jgi:hypothetical protein
MKEIRRLVKTEGDLKERCAAWSDYTRVRQYDRYRRRRDALKGNVRWDNLSPRTLKSLSFTAKPGF